MDLRVGVWLFNLLVILLSFICLITDVKSAELDIRPSTNIQAGAPTITFRCQPTIVSGVTSLYRLDISRLREGVSTEQILGTIQVGKQPELGPGLTSPKYTVSGSLTAIDTVSTSFLQIIIQDPNCNDKGEYVCTVTGGNSGGSLTPKKQTNVTVQENPSSLGINVVPSKSEYKSNDSISMTCNGNVGNPAKTWQWQTRRFPASIQWNRYTDSSDIVTDDVSPPIGGSCSYRQQTVLNYRVKAQDDGLEIRCILDNTEEFSQNFTINVSGQNNGGGDGNPEENKGDEPSDAGMIAGIVIAVIVVIVIIVIVIVVVVRRKKTPGKDYDTGESGKGPVPREPDHDPKYNNRNNPSDDYHKNVEGLHYADLELTRAEYRKNHPVPNNTRRSSEDSVTEYASVRVA
ncbi:hypothetical protein LOTGIDRAFT_228571 [Lottia gigantea]|uniref:Ig-like domain-containing protein n=1 Tax=Lottia gigantea TaxID=225164 RepID=V4BXH8_LOTGI|nr:hypothetical protein LOTGIDRAFT_228571 [Lottia gigantea]ESO93804.1 hypothetical protein LOTGIDRAFT_228571 [Lottia gigantea]